MGEGGNESDEFFAGQFAADVGECFGLRWCEVFVDCAAENAAGEVGVVCEVALDPAGERVRVPFERGTEFVDVVFKGYTDSGEFGEVVEDEGWVGRCDAGDDFLYDVGVEAGSCDEQPERRCRFEVESGPELAAVVAGRGLEDACGGLLCDLVAEQNADGFGGIGPQVAACAAEECLDDVGVVVGQASIPDLGNFLGSFVPVEACESVRDGKPDFFAAGSDLGLDPGERFIGGEMGPTGRR